MIIVTEEAAKVAWGKEVNPYFPWVNHGDEIWQLLERHSAGYDYPLHEPGWYFTDETGDFNGPFETKEKAELALKQYVENM